jgi:hypothetical protein
MTVFHINSHCLKRTGERKALIRLGIKQKSAKKVGNGLAGLPGFTELFKELSSRGRAVRCLGKRVHLPAKYRSKNKSEEGIYDHKDIDWGRRGHRGGAGGGGDAAGGLSC